MCSERRQSWDGKGAGEGRTLRGRQGREMLIRHMGGRERAENTSSFLLPGRQVLQLWIVGQFLLQLL